MVLAARSVKSEHVDLRAIRTEHMQVAGSNGMALVAGSTTDLTSYFVVGTYALYVPTPSAILYVPFLLHLAHSVAGGLCELFIGLYTPPATGAPSQTLFWAANHALPVAGQWYAMSGVGAGKLSLVFTTGGTHNLYMLVKNKTAGTLWWSQGAGYDFMSHFIQGV